MKPETLFTRNEPSDKKGLHTRRYIHLAEMLCNLPANHEHIVRVARDRGETVSRSEAGFTYVGNTHGYEIFRKRK